MDQKITPMGCFGKQAVVICLLTLAIVFGLSSVWDLDFPPAKLNETGDRGEGLPSGNGKEQHVWKMSGVLRLENEYRDNSSGKIVQLDATPAYEVTRSAVEYSVLNQSFSVSRQERLKAYFKYESVPYEMYQLNAQLGQTLPFVRQLPDNRPEVCSRIKYRRADGERDLVSVIIPFHNELWANLLRTIHSILQHSPSHLLREILLVDDLSSLENLKTPLENYIQWLPKIRLLRTKQREGLIRSRMVGARHARGSVLVFLDAHVEVTTGWLEPLVSIVKNDASALAVPTVAQIEPKNLVYSLPGYPNFRFSGTFTWELDFLWSAHRSPEKDAHVPFPTATMIGCGFAVQSEFFFHIGGFDEGMNIWGGENLEISFRAWTCGGSVKVAPCSVVAHVFRSLLPYRVDEEMVLTNLQRLAEVWMDEYKEFFYLTIPRALPPVSDVLKATLEPRKRLRARLHCKPFSWFIKNVAVGIFPPTNDWFLFGQMKNLGNDLCTFVNCSNPLSFESCFFVNVNHIFALTRENKLVSADGERCLTLSLPSFQLTMQLCQRYLTRGILQGWSFVDFQIPDNIKSNLRGVDTRKPVGRLVSTGVETDWCLTAGQILSVKPCDVKNVSQYFVFTHRVSTKAWRG